MKNTFLLITFMIGMLFTMAIGNQLMASHPKLVSCHPELVSGPPQVATVLVSDPSAELISASLPETTISASVSSSIEAMVGDA